MKEVAHFFIGIMCVLNQGVTGHFLFRSAATKRSRGRRTAAAALDCFASLAMTSGGAFHRRPRSRPERGGDRGAVDALLGDDDEAARPLFAGAPRPVEVAAEALADSLQQHAHRLVRDFDE